MQSTKSCVFLKKGGKSQKSERTQDHEIAILDGDLKTSTMILENFQVQCWTKIQSIDFISHENILVSK